MLNESYKIYFGPKGDRKGTRSSKKVDVIHRWIVKKLEEIYDSDRYSVLDEKKVPSNNSVGYKNCDVVVFDKIKKEPILVVPVKFTCSNFSQNKNNYFENCVGDCVLLKIKNPKLKIIPFNIFIKRTPYYLKDTKSVKNKIKKFEIITPKNISSYKLNEKPFIYDKSITYIVNSNLHRKKGIINVSNIVDIDKVKILSVSKDTKYKTLESIIRKL